MDNMEDLLPETKTKPAKRQVRGREKSARATEEREQSVDFYKRLFDMEQNGKLNVPTQVLGDKWVGKWVRENVRGHHDGSNVSDHLVKGWIPPSASMYPKQAFEDYWGDSVDTEALLRRGGLVYMVRDKAVHDLEMKARQRRVDDKTHFNEASRRIGVEGGFVTGRGTNGQTVTFSNDPKATYIASMFGR